MQVLQFFAPYASINYQVLRVRFEPSQLLQSPPAFYIILTYTHPNMYEKLCQCPTIKFYNKKAPFISKMLEVLIDFVVNSILELSI